MAGGQFFNLRGGRGGVGVGFMQESNLQILSSEFRFSFLLHIHGFLLWYAMFIVFYYRMLNCSKPVLSNWKPWTIKSGIGGTILLGCEAVLK